MGYDSHIGKQDMTNTTTFSAFSAGPIGTAYTVIDPAYCIADEEFPASTSTRYASACYVSFPTADPVAEMTTEEFMAALGLG